MPLSHHVRRLTLAGALLAAAGIVPAQASLLVYDFTTAFTDGPLTGTGSTGVLSFDSSIIPAGGSGTLQVTGALGLKDLGSLTYRQNGVTFDLSNTGVFQLDFSGGQLAGVGFGGDVTGPEQITRATNDILVVPNGPCYYSTAADSQVSDCSISLKKVNPVIATEDFTTKITSGSLNGQTLTGSFSFDRSIIPAGGTGTLRNSSGLDDFLAFHYEINGVTFTTQNADAAELDFTNGLLTGFVMGGRPAPDQLPAGATDFLLSDLSYNHTCAYITPVDSFPGGCDLTVSAAQPPPSVPEPGTLLLIAAGLTAAAAARGARCRRTDPAGRRDSARLHQQTSTAGAAMCSVPTRWR